MLVIRGLVYQRGVQAFTYLFNSNLKDRSLFGNTRARSHAEIVEGVRRSVNHMSTELELRAPFNYDRTSPKGSKMAFVQRPTSPTRTTFAQ